MKSFKESYIFFRLQKRKYSSNVIEGGNYNKDEKIAWVPIIAPLTKKEEGDRFCLDLMDILIKEK